MTPGVTGAPGRFITPSSDRSGATRAAKPDRISDPSCRTGARRPITFPGLLSGPDPGSSSGEGGGSGSGRGGIGVGSSGRGCGGCWVMAASKELSEHDAAKRVPGGWTLRRTGTPAIPKGRRTLTHAASPFLQEASGNSTNESPFARAAFRQALDRRGCLVLACRLRPENPSCICACSADNSVAGDKDDSWRLGCESTLTSRRAHPAALAPYQGLALPAW